MLKGIQTTRDQTHRKDGHLQTNFPTDFLESLGAAVSWKNHVPWIEYPKAMNLGMHMNHPNANPFYGDP